MDYATLVMHESQIEREFGEIYGRNAHGEMSPEDTKRLAELMDQWQKLDAIRNAFA